MKIITSISTINQKGQLVLPAAIRKALNISPQVLLQITLRGNAINISPISKVLTVDQTESSYLDVLKKTQGAWKKDKPENKTSKRKLELVASASRKKSW